MEIINLDKICGGCAAANLGTKLDTLKKDLADGNTYSGELLSEDEETALNNICPVLSQLSLGTYVNNMLKASQEGTEIENLTEEQINILNNQTCGGFESVQVGTEIFDFVEEINEGGGSFDYTIEVNEFEYGKFYHEEGDSTPEPWKVYEYLQEKWAEGGSYTLKVSDGNVTLRGTITPVEEENHYSFVLKDGRRIVLRAYTDAETGDTGFVFDETEFAIKVDEIVYEQPYSEADASMPSPDDIATYLTDKWDNEQSFSLKIEDNAHSYIGTATPFYDESGSPDFEGLFIFTSEDKSMAMLIQGILGTSADEGMFTFFEVSPFFLNYVATYNGKQYSGLINYDLFTIVTEVDDDADLANIIIDFVPCPGVTSVKIGNVEQVSGEVVNCVNPNIYTLTTVTGESHDWTVTVKKHKIN